MSFLINGVIPETDLPVSAASGGDMVRVVKGDGKSAMVPVGGAGGIASSAQLDSALVEVDEAFQEAMSEISSLAEQMITASPSPKFHPGGGQLSALSEALTNPAHQAVYVTFIGDSITWGATLPENPDPNPRSGTLSDPRDVFDSPSFVNEFKRHIGRQYFGDAAPVLSNWSYSTAGQSTVMYQKDIDLYPKSHPCVAAVSGSGVTLSEVASAESVLGSIVRFDMTQGATGTGDVTIQGFTGTAISVVYSSLAGTSLDYELKVNGGSAGTFTTDGPTGSGYVRQHTFGYVKNATIQIVAKYPTSGTGVKRLLLEAIRIPKRCRITNQGIIGTEFRRYADWNFGAFGPSVTSQNDEFYFVQLGANNRGQTEAPTSANRLYGLAETLVGQIESGGGEVIMMVSNPATPDYPESPFKYSMGDVRRVIRDFSFANSYSFIDNYAAFSGLNNADYTADGLHPNKLGHAIIVRNIIGALEMS